MGLERSISLPEKYPDTFLARSLLLGSAEMLYCQKMAFLDTSAGKIHYEKTGQGPALVMLNGGPGIDLAYMQAGLSFLSKWRTLYFFDQYGCGQDSNLPCGADLTKTVNHACAFISELGLDPKSIGLLGHSFGAPIALEMMGKLLPLRELIFLNPVPPTAKRWGEVRNDISAEDRACLQELGSERTPENGVKAIEIYSKYYCETWPTKVSFRYGAFDPVLCEDVQQSMGDFDLRASLKLIPKKSLLVTGEKDFIFPALLSDYEPFFSTKIEIEGGKHMPFLDRPQEFSKAVSKYFEGF